MIRLLWIIPFLFVSFSYGNIITIKCIKDFNAYTTTLIFEGTSIYNQLTKFDLIHDYSIFSLSRNLPPEEHLLENTSFWFYEKQINATKAYGSLKSKDGSIELSRFETNVLIHSDELNGRGTIGLSFKFDNENSSFIHLLKRKGDIEHLSFAFSPINKLEGDMYIGGIPSEKINNKYKASLSVNQSRKTWGINIDKVVVNFNNQEHIYYNTHYSYINTFDDRIFVPNDFFDFLCNTTFVSYFQKKICYLTDDRPDRRHINCNITEISNFPDLVFYIDGYKFPLDYKNLFRALPNKNSYFIIQTNYYDLENQDMFNIGSYFFDYFLINFDYETKKIELYSNNPFETYVENKYAITKVMLIINIVILICCIGYLLLNLLI